MIIAARSSDSEILSEIAVKPKAFWGYSNNQIKSWVSELTVTHSMIQNQIVFKYISNHKIIGFYILNQPKKRIIELEFLFVLPQFIGKGIGSTLLYHAFKKASKLNAKTITLLADPNAVAFYKSKGFVIINQKESSIAGRFLPVMQKDLR